MFTKEELKEKLKVTAQLLNSSEKTFKDDDFTTRIAEEVWLEVKGYPIPEHFTIEEKKYWLTELMPIARSKRKSEFNFKYYKKFDVSEIKKELLQLDEKYWKINQHRQKSYYIHKDTETLGNTLFSMFYKENDPFIVKKNNFIPESIQIKTDEIIFDLENHFHGKVLISGYTKLMSGGLIPPHVDDIFYFKKVKRFQIAVYTNPCVYFNVGNESKVFEEGDCYQIDNTIIHSVENRGETPRINLIVDIMPWENIKGDYTIRESRKSKDFFNDT